MREREDRSLNPEFRMNFGLAREMATFDIGWKISFLGVLTETKKPGRRNIECTM